MDQWEQWAKNIAGASGFDSGNIYQNYATAGVVDAAPEAITGKKAAIDADIQERARKEGIAAAEAKRQLEEERKKEAEDPSKAQMKLRPDGLGYNFFDGAGKQIGINQFSMITGKRPDEILADSANPRDQKFVQDYRAMREISNAWVNGDTETLAKYRQADPAKFNELVTKYKSPGEMVGAFTQFYSDYYGNTQGRQDEGTPRFSPGDPRGGESVYGPDRSVSLMDPTNGKRNLGAASFEQTLQPVEFQQPQGNWFQKLNPFSGYKDEVKRYEERLAQNPWMAYYQSLSGR